MPSLRKNQIQDLKNQKKLFQKELSMFRNVMEGVRAHLAFGDILKLILDNLLIGLNVNRADIFLVREDGKAIERAAGIDWDGTYLGKGEEFPCSTEKGIHHFSDLVHGYAQWGLRKSPASRTKKGKRASREAQVHLAQVPIMVDWHKIIGILSVENRRGRSFKKKDLDAFYNFAAQAGLAIEFYRLYQEITALTITDALTQVYNRRHFEDALAGEIKRSKRYSRPCGLLTVDLDKFKLVNDRWGHSIGDNVLKHVAFHMRAAVRNIDVVARIGGEEFAIILPETNTEGCLLVAERLVKAVAEASLAGQMEKVTVSVGVACYPDNAKDAETLKRLSDQSLYEAKKAGRNRVGPLLPSA